MQLIIDVKDNYTNEVINILNNLKDVMINSIKLEDTLMSELSKIDEYKNLNSKEQKETYEEIQHIQKSLKSVELIKTDKIKTYPIEELWNRLDD